MLKMDVIYMIYLTAIRLPPGGSSIVHIYTQTIHKTTQFNIILDPKEKTTKHRRSHKY